MKKLVAIGLALIFLFAFKPARAQESSVLTKGEQRLALSAKLGFGMRDRDAAYQLTFGLLVERPDWLLAFNAPLYGVMTDNGQIHYRGMRLLKAHWDDVGDVGRIISEIRLGRHDSPAQLRLGRVNGLTFNKGSLLDNIYSQINPDASGLTIGATFRSQQGHNLALLVIEPFHPSLVAISGSIHPLAPRFYRKNRSLSSLAVNLATFIDPTIVGKNVNYGVGFEIEQGFFVKNIYFQPFNTYSFSLGRNNLGLGLEIGRKQPNQPQSWEFSASLALLMGQNHYQPVGTLYLLERELFPLLATTAQTYQEGMETLPKEWHGAIKGQLFFALPGRFLARYTLLSAPFIKQFENTLHLQGSFFSRWTMGFFLAGKKYSPLVLQNNNHMLWLTSLETAVAVWRGLTISANYGYLFTYDSLPMSRPVHQFMISFGWEYGRKTKKP